MSEWAPKRFWTTAAALPQETGWAIALDGRQVRTPARRPLLLPTEVLAQAVAAEWQAQEGHVRPSEMPMTRSANAAIDKVAPQKDEVVAYIAAYGATDLVCYRADGPDALVSAQAAAWDPLMTWAREALGAPLIATAGVMPLAQPDQSLAALRGAVEGQDACALTALHDLVMLSGSLVIGLAAQAGIMPAEELWARSRVDEDWQQAQWGEDADAAAAARAKRGDFLHAARFHALSQAVA